MMGYDLHSHSKVWSRLECPFVEENFILSTVDIVNDVNDHSRWKWLFF